MTELPTHHNITESSRSFLTLYDSRLRMGDFLGDSYTELDDNTIARTVKESPRILGKLRFRVNDESLFGQSGPPRTFADLWQMVASGAIDCVNEDQIDNFVRQWAHKYTNKSAEDQLRSATPLVEKEGNFAILPITGKGRDALVPEIIFHDTKDCLSSSEPTSTRLFNNYIVRRELIKPGEDVIDLCCGSGITALIAGYMTKGRIYALDISDKAVATAKHNMELHRLTNVDVRQSDMLTALHAGTLVDKIFINPPFNPKTTAATPGFTLDHAVHDYGYLVINELFATAPKHLLPDGSIYMLYEDIKVFPGHTNAVEWACKNFNERSINQKYQLKTLVRTRRARVTPEGKSILVPFVVYKLGISR